MLGSFNTMLDNVGSNLISFKLFIQHLAKNKESVIISLEICIKTFEMANSVDECAEESFSREPIVLETPRKRDYDEIAEDATRSTSCCAMLLPFKKAFSYQFTHAIQKYTKFANFAGL